MRTCKVIQLCIHDAQSFHIATRCSQLNSHRMPYKAYHIAGIVGGRYIWRYIKVDKLTSFGSMQFFDAVLNIRK